MWQRHWEREIGILLQIHAWRKGRLWSAIAHTSIIPSATLQQCINALSVSLSLLSLMIQILKCLLRNVELRRRGIWKGRFHLNSLGCPTSRPCQFPLFYFQWISLLFLLFYSFPFSSNSVLS